MLWMDVSCAFNLYLLYTHDLFDHFKTCVCRNLESQKTSTPIVVSTATILIEHTFVLAMANSIEKENRGIHFFTHPLPLLMRWQPAA